MPIKPRKPKSRKIEIDDTIREFLFTGEAEKDTPGYDLRLSRFFGIEEIEKIWLQHKDFLLKKWEAENRREIPWVVSWLDWKKGKSN